MKRRYTAGVRKADDQIVRSKQFWQLRIGRDLTDEDAREIIHNVTGLIGVLAEWSRAERNAATNSSAGPAKPREGELRHVR